MLHRINEYIALILVVFVIARLLIVFHDMDVYSFEGRYYIVRQAIYTLVWGMMAFFFANFTFNYGDDLKTKNQIKRMEKISFFTGIACTVKLLVTAVYYSRMHDLPTIAFSYNVSELTIWFLLALFFFVFAYRRSKQVKRMRD